MQGIPITSASGSMRNEEKKKMAGQSFSSPVSHTFLLLLYLNPYAEHWAAEEAA
jgi:hypothetical protein